MLWVGLICKPLGLSRRGGCSNEGLDLVGPVPREVGAGGVASQEVAEQKGGDYMTLFLGA